MYVASKFECEKSKLTIYNLNENGKEVKYFTYYEKIVSTLCVSKDHKFIGAGFSDGIKICFNLSIF